MKQLATFTATLWIALVPAFSQETAAPARPLDALLAGEGAWQMTTALFEQQFGPSRFEWLSDKKDQARFFGPGLSLWEGSLKMNEAVPV